MRGKERDAVTYKEEEKQELKKTYQNISRNSGRKDSDDKIKVKEEKVEEIRDRDIDNKEKEEAWERVRLMTTEIDKVLKG